MSDIEYSVKNGVATILLNRPARKNAFTFEMIDAWAEFVRKAHRDSAVGAVVLTGAGDAFCSGVDLESLKAVEPTPLGRKQMLTEQIHHVAHAVDDLDKPLIAAVAGVAVGAGMDMALMCDMRFAGESAKFSEGYIRVGLVPGDGGCWYLPRIVGKAKALELLLTGDFIDASESLRIGLVNRVYPDADLGKETHAFAERLAAGPPIATRIIKRVVNQSERIDLRTSLDLISSHMAVVQSTEDSAEALAAFSQKRPPVFKGR